jgi:hypothetical protein
MARARSFVLLGVAAWLAACAESTGPPVIQGPLTRADGQVRHLRWQSTGSPRQFAALGSTVVRRAPQNGAAASTVLDHYELAFWAANSRDQEIQINYQAADGSWLPYVWFKVPQGGLSRHPDGTPFADGDSVLITVAIDSTSLIVTFEPTGLEFNSEAPAQLSVWYTGADPDFDASGAVDGDDRYIEEELLGVWVQELATDPWALVSAVQSIPNKLFTGSLGHFSDYSIAW